MPGIRLDFPAQVPDVGINGPLVAFKGKAVGILQQLQPVEDLPGIL